MWLFSPRSRVEHYAGVQEKANAILLELVPRHRIIEYDIEHPFNTFVALEGLVGNRIQDAAVLILPLGPKIFALCSLLVASVHDTTAVWRVSGGSLDKPIEREPSEDVTGLRVDFIAHPGAGSEADNWTSHSSM